MARTQAGGRGGSGRTGSGGSGGSTVQEVKARLSIVDIVRRYVDLKKASGPRWMGPCPFHQETKPSFSVNEEEGFYYCFGCQAAGDLIDFYCRINGLEFKEGLAQLAEEAGVEMTSRRPDPAEQMEREKRKVFLDMYAAAREHFRRCLHGPQGGECREYLARRGMNPEIVERFALGWAPDEWQSLADALKAAGFAPRAAAEAGLLSSNDKGHIYDRFRGRLIFPIVNLSGQVVAFGGRILSSGEPKYINSSDTAIYKKGDHLYGLHQARRAISQTKRAVLTEGYVDVLTLHQFGFENGCGVLGTALTPTQVQRLGGFCSDVDLIFDGDGAGRKAALRSAEMLLARGMNCRVVLMPDGEDVDSLLQKQGAEALRQAMEQAPDGLDYCIRAVRGSFSPKDLVEWAIQFMNALDRPDLISYYSPRIYSGLGLSEAEIRSAQVRIKQAKTPHAAQRPQARSGERLIPQRKHERYILSFAARHPAYVPLLAERNADLLMLSPRARQLWDKIVAHGETDLIPYLDEREKPFVIGEYDKRAERSAEHEEQREVEFEEICRFLDEHFTREHLRAQTDVLRSLSGERDFSKTLEHLKAIKDSLGRKNG
jgi:DNA primase